MSICSTGRWCQSKRVLKDILKRLDNKILLNVCTWVCIDILHMCIQFPVKNTFRKQGLIFFMLDCHLRPESTAAGLVLPHVGWGCLTGQKPTQHWLPANYRLRKWQLVCFWVAEEYICTSPRVHELSSANSAEPWVPSFLSHSIWSSRDLSILSFHT